MGLLGLLGLMNLTCLFDLTVNIFCLLERFAAKGRALIKGRGVAPLPLARSSHDPSD